MLVFYYPRSKGGGLKVRYLDRQNIRLLSMGRPTNAVPDFFFFLTNKRSLLLSKVY